MADFKEIQQRYSTAKKQYEAARKTFYLARQQAYLIENRIAKALQERLLAELPAGDPLINERAVLQQKISSAHSALQTASENLKAKNKEFVDLGNIRALMPNLNDGFPVLMMPLRIQTRFQTIKHIARNIPDDFLIDLSKIPPALAAQTRRVFPDIRPETGPVIVPSQTHMLSNRTDVASTQIITQLSMAGFPMPNPRRWQKVEDTRELIVRIYPDDLYIQNHEPELIETEYVAGKVFWQRLWEAEREFQANPVPEEAEKGKNEKQLAAWKTLRTDCLTHRAAWIAAKLRPEGYPEGFAADLIIIPDEKFPPIDLKSESWTVPPSTALLPETLMVRLEFNGTDLNPREAHGNPIPEFLQLGFDPDETEEPLDNDKNGVIELPKAIRWLTDVDEAEKCGMAIRFALSATEISVGISKIIVTGVKASADPAEGDQLFSQLIQSHRFRPDGFSFLPQGTSTNNIPGQPSGFTQSGLSDEDSFNLEFSNKSVDLESDGQRFASALGIGADSVMHLNKNNRHDAKNALLINKVLWPGTMGYYLENMMRPAVNDADIDFIRTFFESNVTGRGLLPAFRAGKQPYGIVPATAWSMWKPDVDASASEIKMIKFLQKLDSQWASLIGKVKTMKTIFKNTNEEVKTREFRELLAFQAKSTRFFRRLVAGEYLLWSINQRNGELGVEKVGIKTTPAEYKAKMEAGWGEVVTKMPKMLGKFLDDVNYKLTDLVPGESGENPVLTPGGKNYLSKLVNATVDDLRENKFGIDFNLFVAQRSSRLFFYLAKFALAQSWVNAAVTTIKKSQSDLSPFAGLDFEFEYVDTSNSPSAEHSNLLRQAGFTGSFQTIKNKWALFSKQLPEGGTVDGTLAAKIKEALAADHAAKALQDVKAALAELSDLPVEKLDRLFSEHLDLCSFRLDAWMQGLVLARISKNRKRAGFERGLYIGAYGYLENLVPSKDEWIGVKEIADPPILSFSPRGLNAVMPVYDFTGLNPDQIARVKKDKFVYLGSTPGVLVQHSTTGKYINQTSSFSGTDEGFVLTPSLEHASTAGILRAGYEHHAMSQGAQAKTLATSLDSERTGRAIDMLKAINAGHSLNEQIGYFIERSMYEDEKLAAFVTNLRIAFPLKIERNEWDGDQQINEAQKTTNLALTTDGLALIHNFENPNSSPNWEKKLENVLSSPSDAGAQFTMKRTAFINIVNLARDQFDAVGDLVLAESVYQTVKGNPERAAAALRITSDGGDLQLPQVAQVPVESRVLTHRMGFVLNAQGSPENAWPTSAKVSLFARLSPELNRWLADQFPAPEKICYRVSTGNEPFQKTNISSFGLQPIDFYFMIRSAGSKLAETVIPWLAKNVVRSTRGSALTTPVTISFSRDKTFNDNENSIEDLLPLIYSIGSLIENSRPMRPSDFMMVASSATDTSYDNARLINVINDAAETSEAGMIGAYVRELIKAEKDLRDHFPKEFETNGSEPYFYALNGVISKGYLVGIWDCAPRCADVCDLVNARVLADQALDMIEGLQEKLTQISAANASIISQVSALAGDKVFELLNDVVAKICGEQFLVLPLFSVANRAELDAAISDKGLMNGLNEFALEEWIQGLAMVREKVRYTQTLGNLRRMLQAPASEKAMQIIQLPYLPGQSNKWIGQTFPEGFVPPPMATSMAFEFSDGLDLSRSMAGLLTDEWKEKVPLKDVNAAVSMKYNQANSEAPQCILLIASPEQKGTWDMEYVLKAITETMAMAKKRAIDTEIIQTTWMSQFLPALVTPYDTANNTPSMDFRVGGPPIIVRPVFPRPGGPVDDEFVIR